ncbi:MAG: T9SS type A sorting domain-containing protein [Chitinophagales bacterium]
MQKLFSFSLFYFCVLSTQAQVPTGPSIAWQRCYGGGGTDSFVDAVITSDGGFAAIAEFGSTDGDMADQDSLLYPATLMKFDSDMNLLWWRNYGGTTYGCGFTDLLESDEGGFIVGGLSGDTDGDFGENYGSLDFILLETDVDGDILWSKHYGSPGLEDFGNFIQTQDGGFLITGTSTSSGNDIPFHYSGGMGTTDAIIFKTDSIGNLQWLKNLGGSEYDGFLGDPVEISRGQYILSIGSNSEDHDLAGCGISGPKRWIFQMDSMGNITKENFISPFEHLQNADGETTLNQFKVTPVSQGNAYSVLFPAEPGHMDEEGAIAFFDTALLELVDMKQWGGSGYDGFRKSCRDENGNYYFLGFSNSTDYDLPGNYNDGEAFDYWLLATDSNFVTLWSRNFGGSDPCGDLGCSGFVGDIIYKDNIIYVFTKNVVPEILPDFDIECGHASVYGSFGYTDAWLVAFDLSTAIQQNPIESQTFSIYPNPAYDEIIIEPSIKENKQIQIIITDINGKQIYSADHFQNEQMKINTEKFQAGVYLITIKSDTSIYEQKIIIQ